MKTKNLKYVLDPDHERVIYGYARRSDPRRQEHSIETQKVLIDQKRKTLTGAMGEIYCDDISASQVSFFDRPAARDLLSIIQPGDALVVWKMDRLCRKLRETFDLMSWFVEHGIDLYVLNFVGGEAIDMTTAQGRLIVGLFALFAQYEAELLGQRVRDYHEARRKTNQAAPQSKRPKWGYRFEMENGKRIEVPDAQQHALCEELYRRVERKETFRDIAADFVARNVMLPTGELFIPLYKARKGRGVEPSTYHVHNCYWAVRQAKQDGTWGHDLGISLATDGTSALFPRQVDASASS